ncbi:MAG TPA: vWA domain-containing protein [Candidatus Thermoplasmatota archaeon]|nr:vWA domain-containing protein [Candidatus Thermoplasmatota archaeon]
MKAPRATRVVLRPLAAPASEAGALALARDVEAASLAGRILAARDGFEAAGAELVVVAVEPRSPAKVSTDTVVELVFPAPLAKRDVFDVVLLVDASWSMGRPDASGARRLAQARRHLEAFQRQAGDLVRSAALATFAGEVAFHAPAGVHPPRSAKPAFAPLERAALGGLAEVAPRGRARAPEAMDAALAALLEAADPANRHAILLVTDDDPKDGAALGDRARRLGVAVHVLDLSKDGAAGLAALAHRSGGTLARDGFRAAFEALARAADLDPAWRDDLASPGGEEVDFEIVIRALTDEEAETPALARRFKKKDESP